MEKEGELWGRLANPGSPGKWLLKWSVRVIYRTAGSSSMGDFTDKLSMCSSAHCVSQCLWN